MNQDETTKKSQEAIKSMLKQFTSSAYHYPYILNTVLTDGAKWMADLCKAYWLLDVIASYQGYESFKKEHFQTWKLEVTGDEGVVIATDGNNNQLCKQFIPDTDFPLDEVTLFACYSAGKLVIMLPSEY